MHAKTKHIPLTDRVKEETEMAQEQSVPPVLIA